MINILNQLLARIGLRKVGPEATGDRDSLNYFKLGTQYYAAARAASFAGCLPVAGNLFHHALEMYMKGDLCLALPRRQLKSHGHKLKRIWKAYKGRHGCIDLSAHDDLIAQLDQFERVRYPDSITDLGMAVSIAISGANSLASMSSGGAQATPRYGLSVAEVDQLVKTICEVTSRNPEFFFVTLSSEGRSMIHRDNLAFQ